MRMLITGGTGLVGSALAKKLAAMGHNVRILTRNAKKAREKLGSGFEFVSELDSLDGVDAVVNLAGEPLGENVGRQGKSMSSEQAAWGLREKYRRL